MFIGLKIGSSGMKAAQGVMDNVADQISNVSTDGYKQKRVDFNELIVNQMDKNQVQLSQNAINSGINAGSKATVSKTDFRQGVIVPSESNLNMALEGKGFFGVVTQDGEILLTRNGGFHQNADKSITDDSGNFLSLDYYISKDQWPQGEALNINQEGLVSTIDNEGKAQELGKVIVYMPENNDNLGSLGESLYARQNGSTLYNSKDNPDKEYGAIMQKSLEGSNVDTVLSMTDMIITQRAYQANAKSITTADEMLEIINAIL